MAPCHPVVTPDFEACLAMYDRVAAIQGTNCDLLLAEIMSSVHEMRAAAWTMREAGCRAWIALSVDDGDGTRPRSGGALAEVLEEGPVAVLLSCSRPKAIGRGMSILAGAEVPIGACANGFPRAAELKVDGTVEGMGCARISSPTLTPPMRRVGFGAASRSWAAAARSTRPHRNPSWTAPRRRLRGQDPRARLRSFGMSTGAHRWPRRLAGPRAAPGGSGCSIKVWTPPSYRSKSPRLACVRRAPCFIVPLQ